MRSAGRVLDDDLQLWGSVVSAYTSALQSAEGGLRPVIQRCQREWGVQLALTVRPKITRTVIEKLQREQSMALNRIQDVAGARITADSLTLEQQERLAARLVATFGQSGRSAKVVDRRGQSMHAYRALHVHAFIGEVPFEIQVRTPGQDAWAQVMEGVADRWGRGVRYGLEPDDPQRIVLGNATRSDIVTALKRLSELGAQLDEAQRRQAAGEPVTLPAWKALADVYDLDKPEEAIKALGSVLTVPEGTSDARVRVMAREADVIQAYDRYHQMLDRLITLIDLSGG